MPRPLSWPALRLWSTMPRRPQEDKALMPTGSQSKLGTCSTNSPMLLAPSALSLESLNVVIAMGTSCAFSALLRAVTTTSSRPLPCSLSWARAGSGSRAPHDNRILRPSEPLSMQPPIEHLFWTGGWPCATCCRSCHGKLFAGGQMGYRSNERCPAPRETDENASALSALLLDLYRYSRELTLTEFQGRALRRLQDDLAFDSAWWGVAHSSHDIHGSYPYRLPSEYPSFYLEHVKSADALAEAAQAKHGETVRFGAADFARSRGLSLLTRHFG